MSIIKSIKGLFGQTIHYKDGKKIGESWDGFIPGSKNHYDESGAYIGYSDPGLFADQVHHDQYGGRIGETWTDDFGVSRHYDNVGRIGTSCSGILGQTTYLVDNSENDKRLDFDDLEEDEFDGDSIEYDF